MNRKEIVIGLFGFGCVGNGLHEVLQRTPGLRARLKKVCIRDPRKPRAADPALFTTDRNEILNDPEINVVVELIDDAEAAYAIVTTALRNGKAVVSANKKMIAEHLAELIALQETHSVPLLYEAACCASIPIIRNLEEYYDNDLLESIEGIINGSTNYILTKAHRDGLSYADALAQAQALGYAESDPTLDTGGYDAKYKLLILIAHAFGLVLKPDQLFHLGIDRLGPAEFTYAREKGCKIKLVARAWKTDDGRIAGFVMPAFVPADHKLHQVDDVYNGLITETCFADTQFFMGKGAGAHPTASAVLSDLSALSYDYKYEYKKIRQQVPVALTEETSLRVLLRVPKSEDAGFEDWFSEIEEVHQSRAGTQVVGIVSVERLRRLLGQQGLSCVLIDPVKEVETVDKVETVETVETVEALRKKRRVA
jgi:homoserine dehydrogenase